MKGLMFKTLKMCKLEKKRTCTQTKETEETLKREIMKQNNTGITKSTTQLYIV